MKKWLVAALLVAALLVLIAPGIVGRLAEKNIEENIEWAAADSPGVIIETESFERGWFGSVGRHRISLEGGQFAAVLDDASDNQDLPSLIIETELEHGPLPGGSLSPGLANTVSTFQIDPGNGEPFDIPGQLTSRVGLNGNSDSELLLEAGSFQHDEGQVEWQGAELSIQSHPGPGTLVVAGEVMPWKITAGNTIVDFDKISVQADQARSEYGFKVGTVDLQMGSVVLAENGTPFSIESVSLTAESSIDGDRVNAQSAFAMNSMTVPAVGEVSFTVDFNIDGADAAAAGIIGEAVQEAQSAVDPEAALANMYPQIEDDLGVIFARGFSMNLNQLDISLPQGLVSTTMEISIPENDADGPVDWAKVLLQMSGKLDMRIPGAIYQMAAMMNPQAGQMVAMGILVQDGEDYVLNAEYAQGLFNVNGTPMPIPLPQ